MCCLLRLSSQLLKKCQRKVITSPGENPKRVVCYAFVVGGLKDQDRATATCCATDSQSVAAGV